MKLKTKIKVIIGTISIAPLTLVIMLGIATPALAPTKADAQTLMLKKQQMVFKKYENATVLTKSQLVELLSAVGFEGKALRYAWAIAMKESHGRPLAYNGNLKTGDNSWGVFQINMLGSLGHDRRGKFNLASNAELLNPVTNAQVAYYMSGKGKDWSAWKGTNQKSVRYWLTQFPHKTTTTQAHKAKAKAVAKAKAKPTQKQ